MLRAVHRSTSSFSSSNLLSSKHCRPRVQQQLRAGYVSISKIDRKNDDGTEVVRRLAALPVNSNSRCWQRVMREEAGSIRSRRRSSAAIGPEFSTSVASRLREIAVARMTPTPNVEERAMVGCCRTPTVFYFSATAMRRSGFPALTPAGTCGGGSSSCGGGPRSLGRPYTYRPGIAWHGSIATVRTYSQKTNHESSETVGAAGSGGGGGGGGCGDRPATKADETPTLSSSSPAAAATPPASSSVLSSALVGDQMTVIAVAVLTLLLVLSPALVDRIRNREQYDDFFNFDDPLDDLALELYRLSREECQKDDESADHGSTAESGSNGETAAPRQKNVVENLLRDVFQSAALQQAAQQFVVTTLQSEPVRSALQHLLKELAMDLLQDPETIAQVVQLLNFAIQNDQVRKAAQELVIDLVNDPAVKAALVSVIQRLGQDGAVQEASQALLRDTAHAVLNDEDVMDHSMEFATDVLGDDVVQQTAGEALRNTVGHAVRPAATTAVWGAAGLAWMAVALLAISYANHVPNSRPSSTGADRGLDRALDGMDRSLTRGSTTTTSSGRLMDLVASLPGRVFSLLIWPFRLVAHSVQTPFVALGRTVQAGTVSATNWVVSLPSRLTPTRESLFHLPGMVLSAVMRPLQVLGRMAAASFSSITSGIGETLSAVSKRLSVSLQEGVESAGARFTQASAKVVAWSIDVLRNLARVTWSRGSEATSWTVNQLGRSWTYVLSRAATALTALRDTSPRYRAGMIDWLETCIGRINDALTDWSLATEKFIRSLARWNASK